MFKLFPSFLILFASAFFTEQAHGQVKFPKGDFGPRKVIGIQATSEPFRKFVQGICDPTSAIVPDNELVSSDIYFRLTDRKYVLTNDGQVNPEAALGGTPYVFLTVPQVGYGRNLYEIYSDLGYGAEDILKQRNRNMVALVLRYRFVDFNPERTGQGPLGAEDFDRHVYVPTWANAFALFARLADDQQPDPMIPFPMSFRDDAERDLARYFPAERREHITLLPYSLLRTVGGPDWDYRQLLESKMSMNAHFRGVGVTANTLCPANDRKGVPEFIGPNRKIKELLEYAVIDFGSMQFREIHD